MNCYDKRVIDHRDQYKQLNTVLAESLDEEDGDAKEEEEMAVDAEDEDVS